MYQLDMPGFAGDVLNPFNKSLLIGMGGISGKCVHTRPDVHSFAIKANIALAVTITYYITAWRPSSLVTHKEDVIGGVFKP